MVRRDLRKVRLPPPLVTAFLGTPLILRFSLQAPSGWAVRMLYILERRPTYSRILAEKISSPSLPSCPITSMALARAAAESALRSVLGSGLAGHVKKGGAAPPWPWRGAGPAA